MLSSDPDRPNYSSYCKLRAVYGDNYTKTRVLDQATRAYKCVKSHCCETSVKALLSGVINIFSAVLVPPRLLLPLVFPSRAPMVDDLPPVSPPPGFPFQSPYG